MRVFLLELVTRSSFQNRHRACSLLGIRARVALGLVALLAASCQNDPPAKETLLIAGNTAMTRYLAPLIKEFTDRNPNVNVVCESGGTTAAVVAVKRGAIDIAAMNRQAEAAEDDEYLRDYQICRDGIAVVVNKANPVSDLTKEQLEDIFDGTTRRGNRWAAPKRQFTCSYARKTAA